jgi:hypothetical protein
MSLLNHGQPGATSPANPRQVTGQYLAKARLTRRQRAKLAAALSNGTAVLAPLTVKQSAVLARVPVLDVTKARRNDKPHGNGRNGHKETLAERIARSSPAERLEAARALGIERVWDQMISPVLAEEQAAVAS